MTIWSKDASHRCAKSQPQAVSERYVAQRLPLAMLKPELVEGARDGTGDWSISAGELSRGVAIPVQWEGSEDVLIDK